MIFLKKLEFLVVWLPLCVAVIMDPFFFIIVIGFGWYGVRALCASDSSAPFEDDAILVC